MGRFIDGQANNQPSVPFIAQFLAPLVLVKSIEVIW